MNLMIYLVFDADVDFISLVWYDWKQSYLKKLCIGGCRYE